MKWIAIAGGWRKTHSQIEKDIKKVVREIISRGDGIVSGGALGVDYIATKEALTLGGQLKIFIPSTLEVYKKHYFKRAEEGVITKKQVEMLITQLEEVKKKGYLIEGVDIILNKETYFNRITKIIESANELVAFHINETEGTQDTINKAKKKNIPVKIFNYLVK
jgi:hypothetical protein